MAKLRSNLQKNVDELLNRLDEYETDINKICGVTYNLLMLMSIKDGVNIINNNNNNKKR